MAYFGIMPFTISPFVIELFKEFILTDEVLLKLADQYNLSPQIFAQLKKYYTRIPFIKDKEYLLSLFMTFGESLWDGVVIIVVGEQRVVCHIQPVIDHAAFGGEEFDDTRTIAECVFNDWCMVYLITE